MDSSVKITSGSLKSVFDQVKEHGIALQSSAGSNSLAQSTDIRTMYQLGELPCTFRDVQEFYATFIIIHKSRFVLEHIMRPWLSCALTDGCMSMSRDSREPCPNVPNIYGVCHRFDQSVLSIILNRLYHDSLGKVSFGQKLLWTKHQGSRSSYSFLPNFVNEFIFKKTT